MSLVVEAIKIEELELVENNDKSNIYIAKVEYSDLNKICKLGNVSINREVDLDRAEKMVEYIKNRGAFYPTIVVATTKKNIIEYNDLKKSAEIKIRDEQDKFIVLDGQHRFNSINLIPEEVSIRGRYQSVLIVENINNFQQRKLFLDINDTPRRVTTGTKLRFDKTIANYISLSLVDSRESILSYVLMDDNQTSTNKKIPYKYIVKFNEKLISILSQNFKKGNIDLITIDKYKEEILQINNYMIDLVEFTQCENYEITKYELYYIVLGEKFSNYIKDAYLRNKCIDLEKIKKDFKVIEEGLQEISKEFLSNIPKSQTDKKGSLDSLLSKILKE